MQKNFISDQNQARLVYLPSCVHVVVVCLFCFLFNVKGSETLYFQDKDTENLCDRCEYIVYTLNIFR